MDMTEIMARVQEMNAQRAEATAAKRIEVKKTQIGRASCRERV